MAELKFTEEHEWIRVEGDVGTVGITTYAQEQLGDVVFVELPEVGRRIEKGALTDDPAKVNADAQGDGWFVKIRLSDISQLDGLMDEAAYKTFVEGLH